jgi:curved DNA-binding protein CbpA
MVLFGMQWASWVEWVLGVAGGIVRRLVRGDRTLTLYHALGVAPTAGEADIKAAYRGLARQLHPDVNGGDAACAGRLAEVNDAYAILSDPEARSAYDRDLARRQAAARRCTWAVAATSVATFAVTAGLVSFAVRRHLAAVPGPEARAAHAMDARAGLAQAGTPSPAPAADRLGGAADAAQAAVWKTYRDPRFDFTLRYPAGVFAFDAAKSDANVHTFVSRDGQALLRIVAAKNTARIGLAELRRSLMKGRYAGAVFHSAPRHRHWFALSGTRGKEVFLERITYSCDGRSMHGWQMMYPVSQHATYDELAKAVLRNAPHGNGPGACDARSKPRSKARRR